MKITTKLMLPLLGLAALSAPSLALAANCTVSNGNDSGAGSLRDCIDNVATNPGDTVTFNSGITVTLTSGQILISQDITVQGADDGSSIVDGNANDRVFEIVENTSDPLVYEPTNVTFANLTIRNGLTSSGGAGIYSDDYGNQIRLVQSTVTDNQDTGGCGGGIYAYETYLILDNSTISANESSDCGGGIYSYYGTIISINGTQIINNFTSDGSGASGGGLYIDYGINDFRQTTISGNNSDDEGGGIYMGDGGTLVSLSEGSTLSNNTAKSNGGGVVIFQGQLNVTLSTIDGNKALDGDGGAIYTDDDDTDISIISSTVSNNQALDADNSGDAGSGGAVYDNAQGNELFIGSTFVGNSAVEEGGAFYFSGYQAYILNSTFSGNSANQNGGAITNYSLLTLNNVTIANNTADADGDDDGEGGGLYNGYNTSLSNTIIANNTDDSGQNPDCYSDNTTAGDDAALNSVGHNLIGVVSADCNINGATSTDLTGDPGFDGGLADNGGPTQTIALASDSQAVDAGDNVLCEPTDQRGITRPQEENCDIGAFEFVPPAPPPPPPVPPVPPSPLSGGGCSLGLAASGLGSIGSFAFMGLGLVALLSLRRKD